MNLKSLILFAIAGYAIATSRRTDLVVATPPLASGMAALEGIVSAADLTSDELAEIYQALLNLERTINESG